MTSRSHLTQLNPQGKAQSPRTQSPVLGNPGRPPSTDPGTLPETVSGMAFLAPGTLDPSTAPPRESGEAGAGLLADALAAEVLVASLLGDGLDVGVPVACALGVCVT